MLNALKKKNEQLIELYINDQDKLNKQLLIKRILGENNCFLKISIETAYSILSDLQVDKSKIKEVYNELIDYKNLEKENDN